MASNTGLSFRRIATIILLVVLVVLVVVAYYSIPGTHVVTTTLTGYNPQNGGVIQARGGQPVR